MAQLLAARRLLAMLCIILAACVATVSFADVSVRGYYRKNGTYVQPHMRSNPNGNFYDNWSTKGNVNPYTGKLGTRVTPPAGYGGSRYRRSSPTTLTNIDYADDYSFDGEAPAGDLIEPKKPTRSYDLEGRKKRDEELRRRLAAELASEGVNVNWQEQTAFELGSVQYRMDLAKQINTYGYDISWDDKTVSELYDIKMRVRIAKSLRDRGFDVSWEPYTLADLNDIDSRIRLVTYLRHRGVIITWQKHSYAELSKMRIARDFQD